MNIVPDTETLTSGLEIDCVSLGFVELSKVS